MMTDHSERKRVGSLSGGKSTTKDEEQMMATVTVHGKEKTLCRRNIFHLSIEHPVRWWSLWLVEHPLFDKIILCLIVLNSCVIAGEFYIKDEQLRKDILHGADILFTPIFLTECLLKIMAWGFAFAEHTYFRGGWNWLDFLVVVGGLFALSDAERVALAADIFRDLRPLRILSASRGMRMLVNTMLLSTQKLANVLGMALFIFTIFGVLGMTLWGGRMHSRCRLTKKPEFDPSDGWVWEIDEDQERLCGGAYECGLSHEGEATYCGSAFEPPKGTKVDEACRREARRSEDLNFGITHFDHLPAAWIVIFQTVTMEGWVDIMYMLQDSYNDWAPPLYFCVLVLFGSFFLLNISLAVVFDSFSKRHDDQLHQTLIGSPSVSPAGSPVIGQDAPSPRSPATAKEAKSVANDTPPKQQQRQRGKREDEHRETEVYATPDLLPEAQQPDASPLPKELRSDPLHHSSHPYRGGNGTSSSNSSGLSLTAVVPVDLFGDQDEPDAIRAASAGRSRQPAWRKDTISSPLRHRDTQGDQDSIADNDSRDFFESCLEELSPPASRSASHRPSAIEHLLPSPQSVPTQHTTPPCRHQLPGRSGKAAPLPPPAEDDSPTPVREVVLPDRKLAFPAFSDSLQTPIALHASAPPPDEEASQETMSAQPATAGQLGYSRFITFATQAFSTDKPEGVVCQLANRLVSSSWWQVFVVCLIVLNTLVLMMDRHPMSEAEGKVLSIAHVAFTVVFGVEMVLMHLALGFRNYWTDGMNCFDGVVVIVSFVELGLAGAGGGAITALRAFRLFRIFRLAKSWVSFRCLLRSMLAILLEMGNFLAIVIIFILVSALIGVHFFRGRADPDACEGDEVEIPRVNFDNLHQALTVIFIIFTGEDWNSFMYDGMRATGWWAAFYFIIVVVIGNFLVLNIFLAILMSNFEQQSTKIRERAESQRRERKAAATKNISQLIANLKLAPQQNAFVGTSPGRSEEGGKIAAGGDNTPDDTPVGNTAAEYPRSTSSDMVVAFRDHTQLSPVAVHTFPPNVVEPPHNADAGAGVEMEKRLDGTNHLREEHDSHVAVGELEKPTSDGVKLPPLSDDDDDVPPASIPGKSFLRQQTESLSFWAKKRVRQLEGASLAERAGGCFWFALVWVINAVKRVHEIPRSWLVFHNDSAVRQMAKRVVSDKRFDSAILVCIVLSSVAMAWDNPLDDPDDPEQWFLFYFNIVMTFIFTVEFMLKTVANGFCFAKNAYLRDAWNWLDFFIVADLANQESKLTGKDSQGDNSLSSLKSLRAFRALRPLRLISRNESLRLVVNTLLQSVPSLLNVLLVSVILYLIFAILGVNYFKGAFGYCDGIEDLPEGVEITTKEECENNDDTSWEYHDAHFDDVFEAMFTLFEMSTTEGWIDVLYAGIDAVGIDKVPRRHWNPAAGLYFVLFMVVGSFFVLNMCVGVIVDTFNRLKREAGSVLLTPSQLQWVRQQRQLFQAKRQLITSAEVHWSRAWMYSLVTSRLFEMTIMACIVLNTVTLALRIYPPPYGLSDDYPLQLNRINNAFVVVFNVEFLLKFYALRLAYFSSGWNIFDFICVLIPDIQLLLEAVTPHSGDSSVFTVVRVFRIARLFRLIRFAKGLDRLFQAFILSIPKLINVGLLLFLLLYIFSMLGISLFAKVGYNGDLNDHANFRSTGFALLTLFRCMTGEDWHAVMYSTANRKDIENPLYPCKAECLDPSNPQSCLFPATTTCNCNCMEETIPCWDAAERGDMRYRQLADEWDGNPIQCGNQSAATMFFSTYTVLITFVILNLFIAVILDSFEDSSSHTSSESDNQLLVIQRFILLWQKYDRDNIQLLPIPKVMVILHKLGPPVAPDPKSDYSRLKLAAGAPNPPPAAIPDRPSSPKDAHPPELSTSLPPQGGWLAEQEASPPTSKQKDRGGGVTGFFSSILPQPRKVRPAPPAPGRSQSLEPTGAPGEAGEDYINLSTKYTKQLRLAVSADGFVTFHDAALAVLRRLIGQGDTEVIRELQEFEKMRPQRALHRGVYISRKMERTSEMLRLEELTAVRTIQVCWRGWKDKAIAKRGSIDRASVASEEPVRTPVVHSL
ncbi:unnamed protein product [Vitrella brassicaformis CCMP3155]|uniref:Ion transport domain-containing protein n=3 Tax=Vitrella brassicaformis TaxID=1169539 RepID=A0A0G4G1M9_VITBC|nr:unnamed protein product [Vitrella brassicaformis CCMP3155]|eukprot:CEM21952.1 unnamed protein product [Vitrella brassicaformis CCMP3155]